MSQKTYALTLLAKPELRFDAPGVERLSVAIGREFQAIRQLQREDAARFTMLGLMLARLKHSLPPRSGFQARSQEIICGATGWTPKTASKNASLAMRLAMTFLEKSKVSAPDLLALPGDQLSLDVGDNHPAQRFLSKLSSFVGELTRTELLIKHGLTNSTRQDVGANDADDDDADLTPEQKAERDRETIWLGVWNPVQAIHSTLTDPTKVQQLRDAAKVEQLKAELVESTKLVNAHLATLRAVKI